MAELDPRVTPADIQKFLDKEKASAETSHRKEKDDENKSYYSGQLDLIDRLEGFMGA